jgi:hypothetical protein
VENFIPANYIKILNMKQIIQKKTSIPVILGIALILTFSACTSNPKKQASNQETVAAIEGWTLLFNGQSLEGWEITNFGPQGPVYVSGGNIILEMGDAITGITWKDDFPVMNYEVQLEAKKVTGNDFFCGMTFPVYDMYCTLIVGGWSGPVVGLSTIDGLDASENETHTLKKFEHDTWYTIRLRVTPEKIETWIDDEQVVDLPTEGRKLSIRPEVSLSRPFGIASWRTTAALRNIIIKELPGSDG